MGVESRFPEDLEVPEHDPNVGDEEEVVIVVGVDSDCDERVGCLLRASQSDEEAQSSGLWGR